MFVVLRAWEQIWKDSTAQIGQDLGVPYNPRSRPSVLPKICQETSANMAAGCWSGDQAMGLGRRPLPDVWFCGNSRTEALTCMAVDCWRRRCSIWSLLFAVYSSYDHQNCITSFYSPSPSPVPSSNEGHYFCHNSHHFISLVVFMALSMAVVYKASTAAKPVYLVFSQFRNRGYPSRMVYLASLSLSLSLYIYIIAEIHHSGQKPLKWP